MSDLINQDEKINSLIDELSKSRNELMKYIVDLDDLRGKVGQMFPQGSDFRNKYALEEKMKTMSSLYSTVLSVRQEINKTIKEEIDIRRKLESGKDDEEIDIRSLAAAMEKHRSENKSIDSEAA